MRERTFHIRRPYILVTEVSSPEGMGDYFSLALVCMCVSVQACMGVCRVTANDYLYTSRFGSELCASGQSLTMTETLKHPGGTSN